MSTQLVQIYQSEDGRVELEIRLEQETLWLTQAQIADLFQVKPQNITQHLKNVFDSGELIEAATCKDFLQVQKEGRRMVEQQRKLYNLDAIISVGYRVNSSRATQFRIWATRTLKQHLVDGYTLNQRRLKERGIEFEQVIQLLSNTLANQQLVPPEGSAVLSVIADYARSWSLLQGYDEQSLAALPHKQTGMQALELTHVLAAIGELKSTLIAKGEATELFGQLRGEGLASSIAPLSKALATNGFTPMWPAAPRICCTSSSKITRWPMATSAAARFCSCGTCASTSTCSPSRWNRSLTTTRWWRWPYWWQKANQTKRN